MGAVTNFPVTIMKDGKSKKVGIRKTWMGTVTKVSGSFNNSAELTVKWKWMGKKRELSRQITHKMDTMQKHGGMQVVFKPVRNVDPTELANLCHGLDSKKRD